MEVRRRLKYWSDLVLHPTRWLFFVAFVGVLSAVQVIRDVFLSSTWQRKLNDSNLVPSWRWEWWAIFALALALGITLETSYRHWRSLLSRSAGQTMAQLAIRVEEIPMQDYGYTGKLNPLLMEAADELAFGQDWVVFEILMQQANARDGLPAPKVRSGMFLVSRLIQLGILEHHKQQVGRPGGLATENTYTLTPTGQTLVDHLREPDQQSVDIDSFRNNLARAKEEAERNCSRKGISRKEAVENLYADAVYHHSEYMRTPENFRSVLDDYRSRLKYQMGEWSPMGGGDYWEKYFIPAARTFIDAVDEYMNTSRMGSGQGS